MEIEEKKIIIKELKNWIIEKILKIIFYLGILVFTFMLGFYYKCLTTLGVAIYCI